MADSAQVITAVETALENALNNVVNVPAWDITVSTLYKVLEEFQAGG